MCVDKDYLVDSFFSNAHSGTTLRQTTLGPADSVLFGEVPVSSMSFMERFFRSTTQKLVHTSLAQFYNHNHITLQVYIHITARANYERLQHHIQYGMSQNALGEEHIPHLYR